MTLNFKSLAARYYCYSLSSNSTCNSTAYTLQCSKPVVDSNETRPPPTAHRHAHLTSALKPSLPGSCHPISNIKRLGVDSIEYASQCSMNLIIVSNGQWAVVNLPLGAMYSEPVHRRILQTMIIILPRRMPNLATVYQNLMSVSKLGYSKKPVKAGSRLIRVR